MTMELRDVKIRAIPDQHAPLDYLGEYSDTPGPEDRTVDRKERGDMGRREVRYFIAADADARDELYERRERFARGELAAYGIRAEAVVEIGGIGQTITSAGIWGVESDAGPNHAATYAREELGQLAEMLDEMGVEEVPDEAEWETDAPWSGAVAL